MATCPITKTAAHALFLTGRTAVADHALALKTHCCSLWAWPAANFQGRATAGGCLYPEAESSQRTFSFSIAVAS